MCRTSKLHFLKFSANAPQRVRQFDALQLAAASKSASFDFLNTGAGNVHCLQSREFELVLSRPIVHKVRHFSNARALSLACCGAD